MAGPSEIPLTEAEQRALSGIITDLDRVLDVSNRFIEEVVTPAARAGSPIEQAFAVNEREAYDIARVLLLSAQDHLAAISIIAKAGRLPMFALYTLLRGAAEPIVRARHLLDTTISHAERMGRGLNERLENVEEAGKIDAAAASYAAKRVKHLDGYATSKGITVVRNKKGEVIGFGAGRRSIFDLFDQYLPAGGKVFRYLSAFTHSQPWALLRTAEAQPTADPGVKLAPTYVSVNMILTLLAGVASLFDETVGYWVVLAGQPLELWRMAREPPSA